MEQLIYLIVSFMFYITTAIVSFVRFCGISTLIEAASLAATLVGLVLAFRAYSSWRNQKLYEHLEEIIVLCQRLEELHGTFCNQMNNNSNNIEELLRCSNDFISVISELSSTISVTSLAAGNVPMYKKRKDELNQELCNMLISCNQFADNIIVEGELKSQKELLELLEATIFKQTKHIYDYIFENFSVRKGSPCKE